MKKNKEAIKSNVAQKRAATTKKRKGKLYIPKNIEEGEKPLYFYLVGIQLGKNYCVYLKISKKSNLELEEIVIDNKNYTVYEDIYEDIAKKAFTRQKLIIVDKLKNDRPEAKLRLLNMKVLIPIGIRLHYKNGKIFEKIISSAMTY